MQKNGFTLFEILIAMAIVAILATIGYPIYSDHIHNTYQKIAKLELLQAASVMQNYYDGHQTYQGANLVSLHLSPQIASGHYRLAIEEQTKSTFILSASEKNSSLKWQVTERGEISKV